MFRLPSNKKLFLHNLRHLCRNKFRRKSLLVGDEILCICEVRPLQDSSFVIVMVLGPSQLVGAIYKCNVHFRNTLIIIFCDRVWRRDRVDVMRMSQLVDKCGLIHKGHMNLSFISRQFVKSNRTHSSNIAFCLSEKPAIFNDMSSTPTKR